MNELVALIVWIILPGSIYRAFNLVSLLLVPYGRGVACHRHVHPWLIVVPFCGRRVGRVDTGFWKVGELVQTGSEESCQGEKAVSPRALKGKGPLVKELLPKSAACTWTAPTPVFA